MKCMMGEEHLHQPVQPRPGQLHGPPWPALALAAHLREGQARLAADQVAVLTAVAAGGREGGGRPAAVHEHEQQEQAGGSAQCGAVSADVICWVSH